MSTPAIESSVRRQPLADAVAIWSRVAGSRALAWLAFLAVYTPTSLVLAHHKVLWDDEFFTLYLSNAGSWSELLRALATGADQHPPSFFWATHLVMALFGASNVTLRLIPIVGFAAMCGALYEIVGRIVNREWGFCAMFLPLACRFSWYSMEARGYASQLGFVSVAFLCWMLAAAGRRRTLTLPLLALALCGAVGSHYYAPAVLLPLAVGESVRTVVNRRIDWPVWFALGGALVPIAAFAGLLGTAQGYSKHFWAVPHWSQIFEWYPEILGYAAGIPLVVFASVTLRRSGFLRRPSEDIAPMAPWHLAAFGALALLPVVLVVVAKTVTHAFHARHAMAAAPGVCILLAVGSARLTAYSRRYAAVTWLLLVGCYGLVSARNYGTFQNALRDLRETATFLGSHTEGPVVVCDIKPFQRLSFYGRRDLVSRFAFVSDPPSSVEYLHFDTIDRSMLALDPWLPVNVRWLDEWVAENPSFVVFGNVTDWSWVPAALPDLKADARLLAVGPGQSLLLSVRNLTVTPKVRAPGDPPGKPMLFSRMPRTGRPLCEQYLSPGSCPSLD